MRGRTPAGPEYVYTVAGSDAAKERARIVLETMMGACRLREACARLGISEPRFHQLRTQFVEAGVAGVEPQRPGRKPRARSPLEEEIRLLQQELAALRDELRNARIREEVALTLPRLGTRSGVPRSGVEALEKKTPPEMPQGAPPRRRGRPPKNPSSPPGTRKNT